MKTPLLKRRIQRVFLYPPRIAAGFTPHWLKRSRLTDVEKLEWARHQLFGDATPPLPPYHSTPIKTP